MGRSLGVWSPQTLSGIFFDWTTCKLQLVKSCEPLRISTQVDLNDLLDTMAAIQASAFVGAKLNAKRVQCRRATRYGNPWLLGGPWPSPPPSDVGIKRAPGRIRRGGACDSSDFSAPPPRTVSLAGRWTRPGTPLISRLRIPPDACL